MSLDENKQFQEEIQSFQPKLTCPTSTSEAYSLGITVKETVFQTYILLIEHCTDTNIQKTLKTMANLEKKENKAFGGWMNFELNCACSSFYESNGQVLPQQIDEAELVTLTPQVNLLVDEFYQKIDELKKSVLTLGENELRRQREIHVAPDAFAASIRARQVCQQLFEDLAVLYSDEEIRNAFLNMCEILAENSMHLRSEHAKHVVL